ncbi:MAG: phosphatidate cytidylyltransferase [Spirochaetes bacterium]|jgi:phosphatidate cytidylyltransferase|nr:phosphatidate cytidylyltransferase [Spirochaetota bacterium]
MNEITKSTIKRVLSAVVALPVYIYTFTTDSFHGIPVLAASLVITITCLYEYYKICDRGDEGRPFFLWGILAGVAVNIIFYIYAFGSTFGYYQYSHIFEGRIFIAGIALFLMIIMTLQLFTRPLKGGIYSLAVTVFGVIYIVVFFSHLMLMKALGDGFYYILILNIVIMINDSAAYFGGVLFGKHKTKFPVSPNKSWEGYFAGLLFSVISMMSAAWILDVYYDKPLFTMMESAVLGVVLSLLGHTGDLVESAVKRDGTMKDSGSIIPGHGGMWDVFDAMIFSFPFFYYYLVWKGVN